MMASIVSALAAGVAGAGALLQLAGGSKMLAAGLPGVYCLTSMMVWPQDGFEQQSGFRIDPCFPGGRGHDFRNPCHRLLTGFLGALFRRSAVISREEGKGSPQVVEIFLVTYGANRPRGRHSKQHDRAEVADY